MSTKERFERRLTEPDENGCVLWTGYRDPNGYGQFRLDGRYGKLEYAHRMAFFLREGRWPHPGMVLMHICIEHGAERNNPSCVVHTREATQGDNNRADLTGHKNGLAKVPDEVVAEIVAQHRVGISAYKLAREFRARGYQVTANSIYNWAHGRHRSKPQ